MIKPSGLIGVVLCCLKDPDNPVYMTLVDEYILAHEQRCARIQSKRGRAAGASSQGASANAKKNKVQRRL